MTYSEIGQMIKQLREQLRLSQSELTDGIVDVTSISRIETGKTHPHYITLSRIFEKLGYEPSRYFQIPITSEEFAAASLCDRLTERVASKDMSGADALIAEMERLPIFENGYYRQSLLSGKAANHMSKRLDVQTSSEWLDEAIRITIPKFDMNNINEYLLSHVETKILNNMAVTLSRAGDMDGAIRLYIQMEDNLKRACIDEKTRAYILSLIYYNLSKILGLSKRRSEALQKCEEGIQLCLKHMEYAKLPLLLFNKAFGLNDVGDKENSLRFLYQSYYMSLAIGRNDLIKTTVQFAEENFPGEAHFK